MRHSIRHISEATSGCPSPAIQNNIRINAHRIIIAQRGLNIEFEMLTSNNTWPTESAGLVSLNCH